jgi:hypothetical protein
MKRAVGIGVVVMISAVAAIAWAAGDWSSAKDKAERFKSEYEELRKLTPQETRRVVTAICEADEEERSSVASDAHSRVASLVDDKYDDLKDLKEDTLRKLDDVTSDESLKDNHSDAKSYKDDVNRRWETIERMTRSIRGKNHPVVRYLIDEGNRQHRDRQTSSSYCDVYEYSLGSGRADCIRASDCTVVELKPDNSRAISKGRGQAQGYANVLNNSADARKALTDKDSDFSKCTKFEWEVQCYKLCPEIESDSNEMRSTSASWRKCS